jgi:hypothetical protein
MVHLQSSKHKQTHCTVLHKYISKQLADRYYLRTHNSFGPTTNSLSVATTASSDDSNDSDDLNHRHHRYGCVSPIRCTIGIVSSLVAITKYLCWQDDGPPRLVPYDTDHHHNRRRIGSDVGHVCSNVGTFL